MNIPAAPTQPLPLSPAQALPHRRLLVIRLSALGDVISSLGAMAAIRQAHPTANITLLTTPPFVPLLTASGYFDAIWCDPRAAWWRFGKIWALRQKLAKAGFERVYDLQTSRRTLRYFQIWPHPKPEWSGHARGASHCDLINPARATSHTLDRQKFQLKLAGIDQVGDADLGFLPPVDVSHYGILGRYALLVPGCSASQAWKRWPLAGFVAMAQKLSASGIIPVLVGGAAEVDLCQAIASAVPGAVNLNGATDLAQLVSLARGCQVALGNDTGPMHMIAASGRPAVVLTSDDLVRHKTAPRGRLVRQITAPSLAEIEAAVVWQVLSELRPEIA